jgi:hypothetical protein
MRFSGGSSVSQSLGREIFGGALEPLLVDKSFRTSDKTAGGGGMLIRPNSAMHATALIKDA